uniref:DUF7869 domain-containing protein n=1 Tax=Trichogramma kaykai TaxID=54128 RepID=A0ABD2X643_9HYME
MAKPKKYRGKKSNKKRKNAKTLKKKELEVKQEYEQGEGELSEPELSEITENVIMEKSAEFEEALKTIRRIDVRVTDTTKVDVSQSESISSDSESNSDEGTDIEKIIFLRRIYKKKNGNEKDQPNVRKRKLDPANWISEKAKKARISGVAGIGVDNKIIEAKEMGQGCSVNCKMQCHKTLNQEDRENAFQLYWKLPERQIKLQCLINWTEETRRTKKINNDSDTLTSDSDSDPGIFLSTKQITYKVPKKGSEQLVKVCRKMFLDTLAINIQIVRTAMKKKLNSRGTCIAEKDLRGTHTNRPHRYPEDVKQLIICHIKSFPTIESHYIRAESRRNYLPTGLSYAAMHKMLNEELKNAGIEDLEVSHQYYKKVFDENFNYGFYKPQKDKCARCVQYKNISPEEKQDRKNERVEHLKNKKLARQLVNKSTQEAELDSSIVSLHFDFQKVLSTPKCAVSNMYYMSKLVVLNLTVYDLANNGGTCFVWNETVAKKGSNEVASVLMYQLQQIILNRDDVKDIRLVSDNCVGQNKNQNVFTMMVMVAVLHNVKITFRFLEVGHTQSAGDSMHSAIERYTRHKEIVTQKQWADAMTKACQTPYTVHQIDQSWIKDFSEIAKKFNWSSMRSTEVRELFIDPSDLKLKIQVKYDFREEKYLKTNVLRKDVNYFDTIQQYNLPQAYDQNFDLPDLKKKHFQTMMDRMWIPQTYHNDYKKLIE